MRETKSQSKTARLLRLTFDQVHRVMHKFVKIGLKNRSPDAHYYYLSIDEKAIHKGHNYVSILSDEATGIVIEVTEGRTKESVDNLCVALTNSQRDEVKTICTDMWEPYIYGAKTYFPTALHCYDNFHLVSYLNKAVDKVRKREVKQHEILKNTKYVFLKDKLDFTHKQQLKFDAIKDANYEVSKAWRVKENFRDIQFRQTKEEAFNMYMNWKRDALRINVKEITEVVELFDRHLLGIIHTIETGSNNARAERINGSIQELKTIARGYSNTANFRIAILFFLGDLDGFSH